jgi:hypothetical protein
MRCGCEAMTCPERVRDNCSGSFAVWNRDLGHRIRYTSVRHALAKPWSYAAADSHSRSSEIGSGASGPPV